MTTYSTTQNELFIVELSKPFEQMKIQFMPEELNWSRTASISSAVVVGRNNPYYQLTGGEDKLALKLDLYAEQENRQDVIDRVHWLQSLTMNNGYAGPVRNIKLVWGDLFKREVWVVLDVRAQLSQFMPQAGMLPQQAYVELSLALDPKKNRTIADVRRR